MSQFSVPITIHLTAEIEVKDAALVYKKLDKMDLDQIIAISNVDDVEYHDCTEVKK